MADVILGEKLTGRVRQIGRMFLANGEDIPLNAEEFYTKCNRMCSDDRMYPNERTRGRNNIGCTEKDECTIPDDPRRIQKFIDFGAGMWWGSIKDRRPCDESMKKCDGLQKLGSVTACKLKDDKCPA